jgi:hypothetical protein
MQMASKGKLRWLGYALAALVWCAAVAWFLWSEGRPIAAEAYERLQPGMRRAEVEHLLRGPGGTRDDFAHWLNNRSPTIAAGSDLLNERQNQPGIKYWYQDSGVIILRFDADGRVAEKQLLQVHVSTLRQTINRLLEMIGW